MTYDSDDARLRDQSSLPQSPDESAAEPRHGKAPVKAGETNGGLGFPNVNSALRRLPGKCSQEPSVPSPQADIFVGAADAEPEDDEPAGPAPQTDAERDAAAERERARWVALSPEELAARAAASKAADADGDAIRPEFADKVIYCVKPDVVIFKHRP